MFCNGCSDSWTRVHLKHVRGRPAACPVCGSGGHACCADPGEVIAGLRAELAKVTAERDAFARGEREWTDGDGRVWPRGLTLVAMWNGLRSAIEDLRRDLAASRKLADANGRQLALAAELLRYERSQGGHDEHCNCDLCAFLASVEEQSEPREQSPGEGSQNPPDASKGGKERAGG